MFKLWKVNSKAGNATVEYPFAPLRTNKDMRGKPEHDPELCIACGACGVACPADAIRMDTNLEADNITWSIDYGRCIFCGRCEEVCPCEAIELTEEFELAVGPKEDLITKSVYALAHCSVCGKPFAPRKEVDYARRVLESVGGMESAQAASVACVCQECKRTRDAERALSAVRTSNAREGLPARKESAREFLGGHGLNPEALDFALNAEKEVE